MARTPLLFLRRIDTSVFDARLRSFTSSYRTRLAPAVARSFSRNVKDEYVRILQQEYPLDKELDTLMRGWIVRKGKEIFCSRFKSGGIPVRVGTSEGGRLIRASWTPMPQAIADEPVRVSLKEPGVIQAVSVSPDRIREKTSFSWNMTDKGRQFARGRTAPFGRQYLDVLEQGGVIQRPNFGKLLKEPRVQTATFLFRSGNLWYWNVQHRRGRRLWPEPNVFVWKMRKTVRPIGMFKRALFQGAPAVAREVTVALSAYASGVVGFGRP